MKWSAQFWPINVYMGVCVYDVFALSFPLIRFAEGLWPHLIAIMRVQTLYCIFAFSINTNEKTFWLCSNFRSRFWYEYKCISISMLCSWLEEAQANCKPRQSFLIENCIERESIIWIAKPLRELNQWPTHW